MGLRKRRRKRSKRRVPSVAGEFAGAELDDARLEKRLRLIAEQWSNAPDRSLPEIAPTIAALEGTYRFLGNGNVHATEVLAPHIERTLGRCEEAGLVLILHDTSECAFPKDGRDGLGPLGSSKQKEGFFLHLSLAVAADGRRKTLGVLNAHTWVRASRRSKKKCSPDNEHARWIEAVEVTQECVGERAAAIHIMDREGDAYALLSEMIVRRDRFVVRSGHDRIVLDDGQKMLLREATTGVPASVEIEIELSRRQLGKTLGQQRMHPPRDRRRATVRFSARQLTIRRPNNVHAVRKDLPAEITVNVVHVWEPHPPKGAERVEWFLLTTEPIDTPEAITAIVDYYRARWVIEEFFKALKTGCAYETRQLKSYHALVNALMIFLPIACRMLSLRTMAKNDPELPANVELSDAELRVLRAFSKKARLPRNPTVQDALLAIAGLGGHLRSNGPPGWQTIARGMESLIARTEGYEAGLRAARTLAYL
jgi:hypothetical protein